MNIKYNIVNKKITNWSRTNTSYVTLVQPKNYEDLKEIIKNIKSSETIAFKASGCSYGDCYLNDYGKVINLVNFDKILDFNANEKSILVQCAVKMENLLNFIIPKGYYLNSIPGSNNATVGGCINSNVHGKDAHLHGVFANNIINLKVMNSMGEILFIDKHNKKFFHAVGSYGLNYLILEAKLKIQKISSPLLKVKTIKFTDYEKMFSLFENYKNLKFPMMGAWINHFDSNGKGVFKAANWSDEKNGEFKKIKFLNEISKKILTLFFFPLIKILFVNRTIIKKLNYFFYLFIKEENKLYNYSDFYFPQQKYLPEESSLFAGGKVNIQILIPIENAKKILNKINDLCLYYKFESWWMGIKRHKHDNYTLAYSLDGYDITLQWSGKYIKRKKFNNFYKELISVIIENKCLIYLTQDVLLEKSNFTKIYKDYKKFLDFKKESDPNIIFKNNLYERLFK